MVTGIAGLLLLTGCTRSDEIASASWEWPDHQWLAGDAKSMDITVHDTAQLFRLDLDIRHNTDYPYQNVYIRTVTRYPSGREVASVTSLELADAGGQWAGDCAGKKCALSLPLQERFTFPEPGTYTWTIEPYMRMDTVAGIRSLAIACSKMTE